MYVLKVQQRLQQMAEPEYQKFSAALTPGEQHMLGVRIPHLRKLASEIAEDNWQEYLSFEPYYFEERMLQGILIGRIHVSPEERLQYIANFIPRINNWSVCDSFCSGLKFAQKNQSLVWNFLQPYLQSEREFPIRFAVIMMMDYYLNETYIDLVLKLLDAIQYDAYYVKMAVAWALATALAKQPEPTWAYFQCHHLDTDTWRKTIQKCLESRRIPEEQKAVLKELRRQLVKT